MGFTKKEIETVSRAAWEKHVDTVSYAVKYDKLGPSGLSRFQAAIKYAMQQAIKLHEGR